MLEPWSTYSARTDLPLFPVRGIAESRRCLRSQGIWRIAHRQFDGHLVCQKGGRIRSQTGDHLGFVRLRRDRFCSHTDCPDCWRVGSTGMVRRGNLPVLRDRIRLLPAAAKGSGVERSRAHSLSHLDDSAKYIRRKVYQGWLDCDYINLSTDSKIMVSGAISRPTLAVADRASP